MIEIIFIVAIFGGVFTGSILIALLGGPTTKSTRRKVTEALQSFGPVNARGVWTVTDMEFNTVYRALQDMLKDGTVTGELASNGDYVWRLINTTTEETA